MIFRQSPESPSHRRDASPHAPSIHPAVFSPVPPRVHPTARKSDELHVSFITIEQRLILLAHHCAEPHFSRVLTDAAHQASAWLHKFRPVT